MIANKYKAFDLNALEKYKLKEGWFSFATLFLAFITVLSSIVEGRWENGINILVGTGLLAFFLGFGLARIRFVPAILAHSFMISVGMVFVGIQVFPYTDPQYKSWSEKLGSTVLAVVRWCQEAIAGHEKDNGLVFLVGLGLLVWLLGYASVWLIFRAHKPWWALGLLGVTLFINLSYNPPGAVSSFAVYLLASLLLVIRMNVFLNEERWQRSRLFFRPGLWRSAMSVGGVLTLLVTLLAFGLPINDNLNPLKGVMDKLSGPLSGMQGGLNSFFVSPNGDKARRDPFSANNFNSFDNSFTLGGPFKQNPDPILKVSGTDPSYLQSNIFDEYNSKGWVNTYQSSPTLTSTEVVFPPLALGPAQDLPTSNDKGRAVNQITVTQLENTGFAMFVGGDLKNTSLPAVLRYHYEPINIQNVPFQALQKVNGVLVDTSNNNKPVPPTLLPLLTNLYTAYKTLPPAISFVYTHQGANWTVKYTIQGDPQTKGPVTANRTTDGYYEAQVGDWLVTLPTTAKLQDLNIARGSNYLLINNSRPNAPLPAPALQAFNATQNITTQLSSVQIYHARDDSWTFTYDPIRTGEGGLTAKQKFEATTAGQTIKTQIADLERLNQGMHLDYTVQNGQPLTLTVKGYAPNYDDLTGVSAQQVVQPGQSYTTNTLRYSFDEQSLRDSTQEYPDWVKARYLTLPAIPAEVRNLALELTNGLSNPYDKVKRIEDYLRSDKFTYSLDVPYPPANRDFVDYFLFDSKQGYCTYFSTAMDVLVRSIGIPSREVEGFLGGESNGDGTYTIKGTAAHAWTQVYFVGYGWVRFEPTPGRDHPLNNLPIDGAAIPPVPTPAPVVSGPTGPDPFANTDNTDPTTGKPRGRVDQTNPDGSGSGDIPITPNNTPPLWLLLSGFAILAAVGLAACSKLWVRSQLRLTVTAPAAVYARMLKTARRAHLEPRNGMTQYEYAKFLTRKLPNATTAIAFLTDRYVKNRYSQEAAAQQASLAAQAGVLDKEPDEPENYLDSNKVWTRLRTQGEKHQATVQVQDNWEVFQTELIRYRREKFLARFTPTFLHKFLYQPQESRI